MPTRAVSTLEMLRDQRAQVLQVVQRHHGRSVRIFGSVAREEDRPDSDVDFLVDFDPGSSLFDLLHLQDELSTLLSKQVDVVSGASLKPRDRHILLEAVTL